MITLNEQKMISLLKVSVIIMLLMTISGCKELSEALAPDKNASKENLKVVKREKPNLSSKPQELDVDPDSDELVETTEIGPMPEVDKSDIKEDQNVNTSTEPETDSNEGNTNTNAELSEPKDSQPDIEPELQKDIEIISKGIWKLNDDMAREMELATPAIIAFTKAKKDDKGYSGNMLFKSGTEKPEKGTYTIVSKNKMIVNDGEETQSATYKISNGGKILQISFASGDILLLTAN